MLKNQALLKIADGQSNWSRPPGQAEIQLSFCYLDVWIILDLYR